MEHFETKLSEREVFNGRVIRVTVDEVQLENERTAEREIVHHPGGACVAAMTEKDEIYLVRQYRYAFERELWELPAGKLEQGEGAFEAAKRELAEECGVVAGSFKDLGKFYPTVGYCNEVIYTWLATELTDCELKPDEDEFLTVEKLPFDLALTMVMDGRILDGKTVAAILKIAQLRK